MRRHVLVPFSLGPEQMGAARYAAWLANTFGTQLLLRVPEGDQQAIGAAIRERMAS